MENLVEFQNLSVDFRTARGRVHALRDVSFNVRRGRTMGIVGESGSGKTTVIWALMRLLAANAVITGGSIRFDGRDVLAFRDAELRGFRGEQASMVFQDPMTSQIPVLTYAQQMRDILYRRNISAAEKRRLAIDMMRRVGIPDPNERIDQYPHHFSGGMRQRAGIAMALLMNPLLLIADEPTTALDVTMEAQIMHLMRALQEELQSTQLIVSHNLGLIAELCDDVVVLYAGEVVEQGEVRDIFHHARHPYTRALLECDPARSRERTRLLPTISGDLPDLHQVPQGCVFASRCPRAMEVCSSAEPDHYGVHEGHDAKCHLLDPEHGDPTWPPPLDKVTVFQHEAPPVDAAGAAAAGGTPSGSDDRPLLEVGDLRVRFRSLGSVRALLRRVDDPFVDAVLGVSLALRPGETLGVVGESGSGKTTLARAVLGLTKVHSGSVRFEDRELIGLSSSAMKPIRREIAMMFQDPVGSLSPRQTVRALITEPFEIHGISGRDRDAEARRLCDMVGFPRNFLSRYPHQLSGGQARRVGVARALALEPGLILADEPTAGLDVSVQGEILNLMRALQDERGMAYLIITHNLPVVRHIASRLAIMYLGRIVEYGSCEAIFRRPAHPYTEALVNGVPRPDPDSRRTLVSIEGEIPSLSRRPAGCEFHTRCRYAKERCRAEEPQDRSLGDGRSIRCHFPLVG